MNAEGREALEHHVGKWQAREPEMALAEVFCSANDRPRFRAWGALLFELREAVFELSDPRVTAVKTGWWAETLLALGQGQGRHPLTDAMLGPSAPWSGLARALIDASQAPSRPTDCDQAIEGLLPLAGAVSAVEAALFAADAHPASTHAVAIHWLLQRLPRGLAAEDVARVPLNLMARHTTSGSQLAAGQGDALLRDWGNELAKRLPLRLPTACLFRRLRTEFDRARLLRLAAGRGFDAPPAVLSVWRGWRAARSG